MTTTADEPITAQPLSDPIDVELPASSVPPARATQPARPVRRSNSRRTRVTVRRFGLFSVFKFALIFSFCAMVVVWLALLLVYFMLSAAGVTDTVAYWIGCVVNTDNGTKNCVAAGGGGGKVFPGVFGGRRRGGGAAGALRAVLPPGLNPPL